MCISVKAYWEFFIMEIIVEADDKLLNNVLQQNHLDHLRKFLHDKFHDKEKLNQIFFSTY